MEGWGSCPAAIVPGRAPSVAHARRWGSSALRAASRGAATTPQAPPARAQACQVGSCLVRPRACSIACARSNPGTTLYRAARGGAPSSAGGSALQACNQPVIRVVSRSHIRGLCGRSGPAATGRMPGNETGESGAAVLRRGFVRRQSEIPGGPGGPPGT